MTAPERKKRNPWGIVAKVLIGVLAVFGLAALAFVVFVYLAMANFGSNK